jgi:hypothetical protein
VLKFEWVFALCHLLAKQRAGLGSPTASSAIAKAAPAAVESLLAIIADSALHSTTTTTATTGEFIDVRHLRLMVVALMVTTAIVKVE